MLCDGKWKRNILIVDDGDTGKSLIVKVLKALLGEVLAPIIPSSVLETGTHCSAGAPSPHIGLFCDAAFLLMDEVCFVV
jgi:hypothetical protein